VKVVDPHIHLWDTHVVCYPWLANPTMAYSGDNRLLPQRYDVSALLADAQDIQVLGSVNIEANPADSVAEAQWLQSLADNPVNRGHPFGIVAYTDLSRNDAPEILERLSVYPNLRGVRQILNVHADPRYNYVSQNYLAVPQWRENLRRLARYGWSFDLQLYPAQAAGAAEVIDSNPDILFIINHAGMFVDRNGVQGWREWRSALGRFASFENTAIKLSGLAMFDHRWTIESFRPLVLEAIECFGTERCMFASNFPIDRLHASYSTLWHAYAEIVSGMTATEHENLFMHNASRHYRLPLFPEGGASSWKSR
jgi:predicted TIM-barrel fold metal-dependent hydrolase